MDENSIKKAMMEAMKEGCFKDLIKDQVSAAVAESLKGCDFQEFIRAQVSAAVAESMKGTEFQELIKTQVNEIVADAVAAKDEEIHVLREELEDTKGKFNELEQYSRRLCLNVSGVPEGPNESTDQIVMDLAKMADIMMTS